MNDKYNEYEHEFKKAIEDYNYKKEKISESKKLTFFDHILSFIISFSVTIFVVGIIFGMSSFENKPLKAEVIGNIDVPKKITYSPKPDDNINILFSIAENENTNPECFALVGFLPYKDFVSVSLIPPNSLISFSDSNFTPTDLYIKGGSQEVARGLAKFFDIEIEKSGTIFYEGIDNFMSCTGDFTYNVQETLDYPHNQRHVVLPKGLTLMNGRNLCDIMFYPAYIGGEKERADRGTMVLVAFINNLIKNKIENESIDIRTPFFEYIDSNISNLDIENHLDALIYLTNKKERTAIATYIDGTISYDYKYFLINEDTLNRITKIYS